MKVSANRERSKNKTRPCTLSFAGVGEQQRSENMEQQRQLTTITSSTSHRVAQSNVTKGEVNFFSEF